MPVGNSLKLPDFEPNEEEGESGAAAHLTFAEHCVVQHCCKCLRPRTRQSTELRSVVRRNDMGVPASGSNPACFYWKWARNTDIFPICSTWRKSANSVQSWQTAHATECWLCISPKMVTIVQQSKTGWMQGGMASPVSGFVQIFKHPFNVVNRSS